MSCAAGNNSNEDDNEHGKHRTVGGDVEKPAASMEARLQIVEDAVGSLQTTVTNLEAQIAYLKNEINRLNEKIVKQKQKIATLKQANTDLLLENAALRRHNINLQGKAEQAESTAVHELRQAEDKVTRSIRDCEAMKMSLEEKEEELRKLKDGSPAAMAALKEGEVKKLEEEVKVVTEKCEGAERDKRMATGQLQIANGRVRELEEESKLMNLAIPLLTDAGPGRSPRFVPNVPQDFANVIQSTLHPNSRVAVIAVAGVECLEKTCLTLVLLYYLQYRSVISESGDAESKEGFASFLRDESRINLKSFQMLANHPGLNIWQKPFKYVDNVVVFLVCVVGAFQGDLVTDGISPLLTASVLCSSVQLVYLAESPAAANADDCLRRIMTSSDFLLYSTSSRTTPHFPHLWLLVSDEGQVSTTAANSGDSAGTSSNESMLDRARDMIGQKQAELFKAQAFPSGRCEQVHRPSLVVDVAKEIVADLRVDRDECFLSSAFDLCERVVGREVPPLVLGLDGQAVTLREFAGFVGQTCRMAGYSESVLKLSGRAEQAWAEKLREMQITDSEQFCVREKAAEVSAFSVSDKLKEVWEFDKEHPRDESDENSLGQYRHRHRLIWKQCYIDGVRLRDSVRYSIVRGEITSTRQYIEARNSRLDVTKLLGASLTSSSPDLRLLPQYRQLELECVWSTLQWMNTTDVEWSLQHATFSLVRSCREKTQKQFESDFSSIVSNATTGEWNIVALHQQLDDLNHTAVHRFDADIAKERDAVQIGDREEFDLASRDQRSALRDWLRWCVTACHSVIKAGVTGSCLPWRDKMYAFDFAVTRYLIAADSVAFCVRCLPVESLLV